VRVLSPSWSAPGSRGLGYAEVSQLLLGARGFSPPLLLSCPAFEALCYFVAGVFAGGFALTLAG